MKENFEAIQALVGNIGKVVVGKDEVIRLVVAALLARGHVLVEDKPGVGKTVLARALAGSIACSFKRIQCTPDLLPVDVTGYVDVRSGQFKQGPIFANIVLADELNRATPRTQSALLEPMGERQVSIDGVTHPLTEPFFVIATQNPVEHRGVNDLPEAQLDRFQMLLSLGYVTAEEEKHLILVRRQSDPLEALKPVMNAAQLGMLIALVSIVKLKDELLDYAVALVRATRESQLLELGASTRAALQLVRLAQAYALVQQRAYVIPDDIKQLAQLVLPHRVIPAAASNDNVSTTQWKQECVRRVLAEVKVPQN